ncbi:helix-turn-helix domain-containing protein [Microvirga terricola]|uniref:Helix-turn-helix transcriptional regulator n=1 Tax=Microvirga terricola TaxID=2719797 RepID=A0ABX0V663_9HYPH|nr:helix-turn-helix transcriptional regulator [Microvirga terricola]NIX75317.1 helix-turn-helix transcriptional regulator [Microvirga terricola]
MDIQTAVGRNVRKYRLAANLSQDELVKRLKGGAPEDWFDQAYISRLENGQWNVTIKTLWHISRALGVTVAQLVETEN